LVCGQRASHPAQPEGRTPNPPGSRPEEARNTLAITGIADRRHGRRCRPVLIFQHASNSIAKKDPALNHDPTTGTADVESSTTGLAITP
jgi:hypothetical protein